MVVKVTRNMEFSPSFDYIDDGIEHGILNKFKTKEQILKKDTTIAEDFKPLVSLFCNMVHTTNIEIIINATITHILF